MYLVYSVALAVALVLSAPWWLLRMLRQHKYRAGLGERLGRVPERLLAGGGTSGCIWVHAVSVGEVLAVSELIGEMRRKFPGRRVVVSTTTSTGQTLARERFGEDSVFYFPLDFTFAVKAYLRALRPELVVLAETEFWPNFLQMAKAGGARMAVVNGRISDRSLPGYRRWRPLLAGVLRNVDLFLAQSDEDARRLVEVGAEPDRVRVAGNLKFDVKAPAPAAPGFALIRAVLERGGAQPVIVCGSTLEGEEVPLQRAFRAVQSRYPAAVFILAPRHPERFDRVAQLAETSGLRWWRRSQLRPEHDVRGGLLVLDTLGELASVYALGSLAFVGGSLVARGGHNILEPAQYGVPILVGPHTENFRDIIGIFARRDGLRVVTPENVADTMLELLSNDEARAALGRRGAEVFRAQAGATARTVAALESLLASVAEPASAQPVAEKAAR